MNTTDRFSREAWEQNAKIYELIRTMSFNAELAAGTLSQARFKHYITQDAHYLIGFGRALALAAAKAPNPDRIVQFAKAAEDAIHVERELHDSFFRQYQITSSAFTETALSPACHHYVSFLLATAYAQPYEVALGALLPCFWIYAEIGRDIHARAAATMWLACAAIFVVWMVVPAIDDELVRAEIGYAGGTALLCALLRGLYRR